MSREWGEWGRRVRIDRAAFAAHTTAVFAATDEYVASLTETDLDRTIDLGGPMSLGAVLGIIIGNVWLHTGEISALRGPQGAKGYPA